MDQENPTAGDSGASITERLEAKLNAQPAPEPKADVKEPVQAAQQDQPEIEVTEKVDPAKDGQEEESQPQLTTTDLAKYLGIDESALDVDDDGTIKVKTKIDGKEGAAKLADLLKSHQLSGHNENKAREVAEAHKAIETRRQEAETQVAARLEQVEALAKVAAEELTREYQSIDWQTLRQTDPGNYAALQMEYQQRGQKLQGVLNQTQQEKAQQQQQREAQRSQFLAQESEKIPTVIPEWKDKAVAERESKEIVDWMLKSGYAQQAVKSLNTSTALDLATFRKAALFDKLQASKPQIENKLRLAPKLVKPGQTQPTTAEQTLRSLKQTVIKSGGKGGSVAAYLMATGKA